MLERNQVDIAEDMAGVEIPQDIVDLDASPVLELAVVLALLHSEAVLPWSSNLQHEYHQQLLRHQQRRSLQMLPVEVRTDTLV